MATIESRLERARFRIKRRQIRPAVKLLRSILRDDPGHIESLDLLSQLALKNRKFEYAKELLERALEIWPRSARLMMNLGVAHHCLGDFEQAIEKFKLALSFNNQPGMIYYHLGLSLAAVGQLNDAGHSLQRAIRRMPKFMPARKKLAELMVEAGTLQAAVVVYRKILEMQPGRSDIHVDLGNVLRSLKLDSEALDCYRKAVEINPRSVSAYNNLANTLRDHHQYQDAEKMMKFALELQPDNPVLLNGLALICEKLDRHDQAIQAYSKAIELNPDYRKAHYNLGGLQQELGQFEAASDSYQRALVIEPENPETLFRTALLGLLQGNFEDHWEGYEQRRLMKESSGKYQDFQQPLWQGESLEGKTILVYTEQGFGDTLQFVRYLPMLKARGANVVLQCQPRLVALLSRCQGIDQIVPSSETELPEFDFYVAMMSLPGLLQTKIDTIPADIPYLHADANKIGLWGERLRGMSGLKIGIAWQGKLSYVRDNLRSIPLHYFSSLLELPSTTWISLQKGEEGSKQLQQLPERERIVDLAPELDQGPEGFEDTAAVIKGLDLVITSDTSLAHLAGGLGAPVWLALSYVPEWRWQLERLDTPWYPTMRLFRQPAFGDWDGTFAQIRQALQNYS